MLSQLSSRTKTVKISFHSKPELQPPARVPKFPGRKVPSPLQDALFWVPTSLQTRFILREPNVKTCVLANHMCDSSSHVCVTARHMLSCGLTHAMHIWGASTLPQVLWKDLGHLTRDRDKDRSL